MNNSFPYRFSLYILVAASFIYLVAIDSSKAFAKNAEEIYINLNEEELYTRFNLEDIIFAEGFKFVEKESPEDDNTSYIEETTQKLTVR